MYTKTRTEEGKDQQGGKRLQHATLGPSIYLSIYMYVYMHTYTDANKPMYIYLTAYTDL